MVERTAGFAIKAAIDDLCRAAHDFAAQKTMYGGRTIAAGDRIFLFASENEGGRGLFARGVVTWSESVAPDPTRARQAPRVSVTVGRVEGARRALGRAELRQWRGRVDGSAEAELDFKLYRQATNKIVGLSPMAVAFLDALF